MISYLLKFILGRSIDLFGHTMLKVSSLVTCLADLKKSQELIIHKCKVKTPSGCSCCSNYQQETTLHLFCKSFIAKQVCSFFCHNFGSNINDGDVNQLLMLNNSKNKTECMTFCYSIFPYLCARKFWKADVRQDLINIHMSIRDIIHQVCNNATMLLNSHFPHIHLPTTWFDLCTVIRYSDGIPSLAFCDNICWVSSLNPNPTIGGFCGKKKKD